MLMVLQSAVVSRLVLPRSLGTPACPHAFFLVQILRSPHCLLACSCSLASAWLLLLPSPHSFVAHAGVCCCCSDHAGPSDGLPVEHQALLLRVRSRKPIAIAGSVAASALARSPTFLCCCFRLQKLVQVGAAFSIIGIVVFFWLAILVFSGLHGAPFPLALSRG